MYLGRPRYARCFPSMQPDATRINWARAWLTQGMFADVT